MDIVPLITIDFVAIVILMLSICMVQKNGTISQFENRLYITACFLTIAIIVLEMLDVFLEMNSDFKLVSFHKIVNILGFGFCPLVPYLMLMFQNEKYKHKVLTMLPFVLNLFVVACSYFTGFTFQVDTQNHYTRGPWFFITAFVCCYYYVLLAFEIFCSHTKRERNEQIFIYYIISLPVVGSIIQIVFPKVLLIWSCTAVSLMFYYRFVREAGLKFDPLTNVFTRAMLDAQVALYNCGNKALPTVSVIVFDLNDFKNINDIYGHGIGDFALQLSAQMICESFSSLGKCYRFGGDEFVIICDNKSEQSILQALNELDQKAKNIMIKNKKLISYAYGFASFNNKKHKTFQDVLQDADEQMYFNKAKYKASQFLEIMKP
ncbi:GGDEF domain-containing protein [Paludicola sp. MB14-C6]|uniref:GGDEF domain-containing protein n=1 Tax=Paludihabitans sp. MB14-C6 TaxID=3070656 RepID=UPI0027DE58E3|nr:GGDEF domain-containing protein [Paludicola sp. MB14-C6]WMJ21928.1 GGDEF domain-containing protein [Paludicola sp. MB14-C6]